MGLSSAWGGLLTTLPLLVFAVFSLITPRIAHRLGIESVLFLSLITLTVGILWRSGVTAAALFTGTVVVGMGIAMMNVLLPGLIKGDFPDRLVGLGAGRNAVLAEKETVSTNS
ncbi:MAG: hypothetical protein IRY98_12215 [Alicyclobacillaceae bacterium]|nr:hypothetical protein [Alicyclobacillaceae bacterium]